MTNFEMCASGKFLSLGGDSSTPTKNLALIKLRTVSTKDVRSSRLESFRIFPALDLLKKFTTKFYHNVSRSSN